MAVGLPIKIVVLTIVGMAGLAAMLTIVEDSDRTIPKSMYARIHGNELIILQTAPESIEWKIVVLNPEDGTPLEKANVALSGLESTAMNRTDIKGESLLVLDKNDLVLYSNEGYLTLEVKAPGFRDYSDDHAIKIVK